MRTTKGGKGGGGGKEDRKVRGCKVYRMEGTHGRYINIFWGCLVFRWYMGNGDGQDDFRFQVTTMILRRHPNRLNFMNMHFKIRRESAIIAFNIM